MSRDARLYAGPHPVVAHPPCARWGSYWHGSPRKPHQYRLGDDGGCFASALSSVHRYGGVIEHPANSKAWDTFGLPIPNPIGGWHGGLFVPGCSTWVYQGAYGHRALKATWLYAVAERLPKLRWGMPKGNFVRIDSGVKFGAARALEVMSKRERAATPPEFRDLLLSIAGTAGRQGDIGGNANPVARLPSLCDRSVLTDALSVCLMGDPPFHAEHIGVGPFPDERKTFPGPGNVVPG